MPELPEVHTTVEGLKKFTVGKTIKEVWSDFHVGTAHGHRNNLKNKKHFENFKKEAVGAKIKSVERRGKNIIINLNNGNSIVVHMKMTGHLLFGNYQKVIFNSQFSILNQFPNLKFKNYKSNKEYWIPKEKRASPLNDSYNQFIHFVVTLSNGDALVLSDMRKFASVCLVKTKDLNEHQGLKSLGKDALKITLKEFENRLRSANRKPIKSALMDQETIAGIGNIYSDEILWKIGVHPLSRASKIPRKKFVEMFKAMKKILEFSIKKGGDSKSDYRNILGEKGGFQNFHKAYGRKGERCEEPGCRGIIERIVVKGRSAHFCPKHQKIFS